MLSVPFFVIIPCIFLLGFLSLKIRFGISLVTSLPQIYLINASGVDFPIALLFALSLWPELIKNFTQIKKSKIIISLGFLVVLSSVSLIWSLDLSMGLREIIYIIVFIFVFSAAYVVAKEDKDYFYSLIYFFVLLSTFHAALIIIFRLSPDLESTFVLSNYSRIFLGSNLVDAIMDDGVRNNFYDPVKAGGFFVNANIAASYLGAVSALSYVLYKNKEDNIRLFLFLFLIVTVLFTGSKAGVLFVFLFPFFIFYGFSYYSKNRKLTFFMLAAFSVLVFNIVFLFFNSELQSSDFLKESVNTSSIRVLIWNFALEKFIESPLMGLGFGGWQDGFVSYAVQNDIAEFPPHNTLIYAWSKSGILAMFASVYFMWRVLLFSLSLIKSHVNELKYIGIGLAVLSCWLFLHGMGENFGLIGEQHQTVVFAALLGFGYGRRKVWREFIFQSRYCKRIENQTGMVNLQ